MLKTLFTSFENLIGSCVQYFVRILQQDEKIAEAQLTGNVTVATDKWSLSFPQLYEDAYDFSGRLGLLQLRRLEDGELVASNSISVTNYENVRSFFANSCQLVFLPLMGGKLLRFSPATGEGFLTIESQKQSDCAIYTFYYLVSDCVWELMAEVEPTALSEDQVLAIAHSFRVHE